jgi:hypothetical protein
MAAAAPACQEPSVSPEHTSWVVLALDSADTERVAEAVEYVATCVDEVFGDEGAALGHVLRELGIVRRLAELLSYDDAAARSSVAPTTACQALLALGNLSSSAVDPLSGMTRVCARSQSNSGVRAIALMRQGVAHLPISCVLRQRSSSSASRTRSRGA